MAGPIEDKIFSLLGDDIEEEQVETLITLVTSQLRNKLTMYKPDIVEIPVELEYIIVESVVARYNYLGSEGMDSETVEGHTMNFREYYINRFDEDIEVWARTQGLIDNGRGKVLFL